ncbi:MAG: type III secretion system chaperone, partial [Succinivibrionaceae bacterium]|nr:type III secretion system chaperone [Succinivibrionaceae bacterium]
MDIKGLNGIFASFRSLRIAPLSERGLSRTQAANGLVLNISAGQETLTLFTMGERLGDLATAHPEVFRKLLESNSMGGRLGNLRVTYDPRSTAFWICHDISYERLGPAELEERILAFARNSATMLHYTRTLIGDLVEAPAAPAAPDAPAAMAAM